MARRAFKKLVRFREAYPFGKVADLKMPEGCDVIIICVNRGRGLEPRRLLLPHQFYEKELQELQGELAGESWGTFTTIPASSKHYIDLAEKMRP